MMSDEVFFYIWKDMDFVAVKSPPNDPDIPSLSISLKEQKIRVFFPEHIGLIERRTIKRRLDSIARTGIWSPETPPRKIGAKFIVEMVGGEEQLNPTLLISGHKYGSRTRSPTPVHEQIKKSFSPPTPAPEPEPPTPKPEPVTSTPPPTPAPESETVLHSETPSESPPPESERKENKVEEKAATNEASEEQGDNNT